MLRSAPRGDAFDERCGASRGRFHGPPAGCRGAGRAGCGRYRPAGPGCVAAFIAGHAERVARNAGERRHARAVRPGGRARTGAERSREHRRTADGRRARTRGGPQAARDRAHGSAGLGVAARGARPRALRAVRPGRPARDPARRGVARGGADGARQPQPRRRPEHEDHRAGALLPGAAQKARHPARRARGRARAAQRCGHCPCPYARGRGRDALALRGRSAPPAGPQRCTDRLDRGPGPKRGCADHGRHRSAHRPRDHGRRGRRSRAAGRSPSAPPATRSAGAPRRVSRPPAASSPSIRR